MDMAGVARTNGNVASGFLSRKTTVLRPSVSTLSSEPSRPMGPPLTMPLASRVRMRSKECFTAAASSGCPSENFRPSRSSQVRTMLDAPSNAQDSAASGSGSVAPEGKLSSV
ncbi:hypothetical protein SALBM135S_00303 [Streptomyces alboniger]